MKRYLLTLLCLSISTSYALNLEKKLEEKFAKTISYVNNHQNAVWPGFKLDKVPVLSLVDDDLFNPTYAHLYAYNFSPKNTDWQHILINKIPAYYLDHDAYDLSGSHDGMALIAGTFNIDDQATFVYVSPLNTLVNSHFTYEMEMLVHTLFDAGYNNRYSYFLTDTTSFNDMQSLKLTYLEHKILRSYLKDEKINKEETLKDALAIEYYYMNKLPSDSVEFHQTFKKVEQVAAYVGIKALSMPEKDILEAASWTTCGLPAVDNYSTFACDSFEREYLSGIVYGLGLDRVRGSSWKTELMTRGTIEEELLREAYGMKEAELLNRAEGIIADGKYDYAQISENIENVMRPYVDEIKKNEDAYKNQPGIEMQVYAPYDEMSLHALKSTKRNDNENNYFNLSMLRQLVVNAYTEVGVVISKDDHLVIDLYHTPQVYINRVGSLEFPWFLRYKIPADATLNIDGKKISATDFVKANKQVSFDSLKIETTNVNTYVKGMKGLLDASNGVLKLKTTMISNVADRDKKAFEARKMMHDKFLFSYRNSPGN